MGRRSTDPALPNCLACGAPNKRKTRGTKYCSRVCAGNTKHGLSGTKLHATWLDMRYRCRNPGHYNYHRYGGRGITVCERWDVFENFVADMGEKPGSGYTIERIDNNKGYEPGNCKWGTKREQSQNRKGCWTPAEDAKLRRAIADGLNFGEASRLLGRPAHARARRLGLTSNFDPHALRGPKHSPQVLRSEADHG